MNNFSDLFKDVDVNAKYTPTQLQNFFLGIKSQLYDLNKSADSNTDSNFIKPQKIPTNIPQSLLQQDIIEEIENKSDPINKGNIKDTIKTALLANSRNVDQNVLNELISNFNNVQWDNISNYKEAITNIFDSIKQTDITSENIKTSVNKTDVLSPIYPVTNQGDNISNVTSPASNDILENNILNKIMVSNNNELQSKDIVTNNELPSKDIKANIPLKEVPNDVIKKINDTKESIIEQNVKNSELVTSVEKVTDNSNVIHNHSKELNDNEIEHNTENVTNLEDNIYNLLNKENGINEQDIERDENEVVKVTDDKVSSVLDKEELTSRNIMSMSDNLQDRLDILFRNKGGDVPGEGNKDTVPAMLTPGEYVVNKDATEKYKPFLENINSGVPPKNIAVDRTPADNVLKLNAGGIVSSQPSPITMVQNKEISKDINDNKTSEAIQNIGKNQNNQSSDFSKDKQSSEDKSSASAGDSNYDGIRDPAYLMRINAWEKITGGAARVNTI